jgi:predicted transcriptional regulator
MIQCPVPTPTAVTQGALAAIVGTTATAITRLESGRLNPRLGTVARLAEALDATFVLADDGIR